MTTAPSSSGVLSINGNNVAWNDGDSLDDILDRIRTAGVPASFNSSGATVVLERDPAVAGPSDLNVVDVSGNLSQVLGISTAGSAPGGSGDTSGLAALLKRMKASLYGPLSDRSLQQSSRDVSTSIGASLAQVDQRVRAASGSVQTADGLRSSISGVSSDQELLDVTRMEQAFAAAARIASAADEMLTTLIQMGR